MRFLFADAARARRLAKLLKDVLAENGVMWPLNACRQAVADATGYPSFHEIEASAGRAGASPFDHDCAPEVVAGRRERQRAALAARGIPAELVRTALASVPFTGAFGSGVRPTAAPHSPTARRARMAIAPSRISAMRAGNFDACTFLDAGGNLVGFALGSDQSIVHDVPPDGCLEELGVADAPATVAWAAIPAGLGALVAFRDPDDGAATTLHLNPSPRDRLQNEPITPGHFVGNGDYAPWGWEGFCERPPALVTAWSFSSISLAAFGNEARERVREMHAAIRDGRACVVHPDAHRLQKRMGPALAILDRLDPDMALSDFHARAWESVQACRGMHPKGEGIASPDFSAPAPSPR